MISMMSDETLFSKSIESTFSKGEQTISTASNYQFERTLKRTLAGTIKLATDLRRKQLVAVKLSSRRQLSELARGNCAENPQEEIRLMTKLRDSPLDGHQFVIQLLDTYTIQKGSDLIDCNVLEFADGGEFFEHIQTLAQQGGRMDLTSVRNAFSMIAKGVKFIHKNGLVHLDLSLENVLVTKKNILKICDFGLAREGRIFKLNTAPGKFPYMAPEVFAKKEFDGQKADVWSIGVILWCLLTSLALYEIPTDSDARFQRLRNGKQGIKEILTAFHVHGIPDVVIDLLSGMLNVNPTERLGIQQVLDHPWFQSTSHSRSTTSESKASKLVKSTPTASVIDLKSHSKMTTTTPVTTTTTTTTASEEIGHSKFTPSQSSPRGHESKHISPPLDDSWSTYHRLYEQFEEKYGKLIAQTNQPPMCSADPSNYFISSSPTTTNDTPMHSSFHPSEEPCSRVEQQQYVSMMPASPTPSPYSPYAEASDTSSTSTCAPTTTRRSSKVGWKRKKGFRENSGRRLSPPWMSLNES